MIAAGELRDIIKIQEAQRVSDGSGGYETTFVDVISKTYAKVVEERSNGNLIANKEDIINTISFVIRYRPVEFLKVGYRIVWRGFNYTINNIKVDRLRTTISVYCNAEMETSER